MAGIDRGVASCDASPGLHRGTRRQFRVQTFVPPHGASSKRLDPVHDVAMEGGAVAADLVAAEVQELVGKDVGELLEKRVDGAQDARVVHVQTGVVNAEARARRGVRGSVRGPPLRMGREPTGDMARHIQLRHDPDGAVGRVGDQRTHLVHRIGVLAGQFRVGLGLKAKPLVVGEVQVQHVQLVEGHGIDRTAQGVEGDEVAHRVDHEPAPRVARRIADLAHREFAAGTELNEGCESRQRAPFGVCFHPYGVAGHETVGVVVGERGNRRRGGVDAEGEDDTHVRQTSDGAAQAIRTHPFDSVGGFGKRAVWCGNDFPRAGQQRFGPGHVARSASRRRQ